MPKQTRIKYSRRCLLAFAALAASTAPLVLATPASAACANRGTNASNSVLTAYFSGAAASYGVPAQLLKVIAYKESTWRQFTSSGTTLISPSGGIGMMQLTGSTAAQFDVCRLYVDTAYNILAGAAVLAQKWSIADAHTPGTPNRALAENWYLPLRGYNGGGSAATAYADDAVAKLASPPSTIAAYTTTLVLTRPQVVLTSYVPPNPYVASSATSWTFYNSTGTAVIAVRSGSVHAWVGTSSPVSVEFTSYPVLSAGATGAAVRAAQVLLDLRGVDAGVVDGVFDAQMLAAVKSFQTAQGISATGTVATHTWTALLSGGPAVTVQLGSTGEAVRRVQRALTAALSRTVVIDGSFGPQTQQAVKDYQSRNGLLADGVVGPVTWSALQHGR